MTERNINRGLRLGTMLLDHFIMSFIIIPPLIIISFLVKSEPFQTTAVETIAFAIMLLVYLNKDFAKGKSISKRILGFRVIDRQTGEPASSLKCFLRNLTILIWPLEVMVSLLSPTRRIGDLIANTEVRLSTREEVATILPDLKRTGFNMSSIWIVAIWLLYIGALWFIMKSVTGQ